MDDPTSNQPSTPDNDYSLTKAKKLPRQRKKDAKVSFDPSSKQCDASPKGRGRPKGIIKTPRNTKSAKLADIGLDIGLSMDLADASAVEDQTSVLPARLPLPLTRAQTAVPPPASPSGVPAIVITQPSASEPSLLPSAIEEPSQLSPEARPASDTLISTDTSTHHTIPRGLPRSYNDLAGPLMYSNTETTDEEGAWPSPSKLLTMYPVASSTSVKLLASKASTPHVITSDALLSTDASRPQPISRGLPPSYDDFAALMYPNNGETREETTWPARVIATSVLLNTDPSTPPVNARPLPRSYSPRPCEGAGPLMYPHTVTTYEETHWPDPATLPGRYETLVSAASKPHGGTFNNLTTPTPRQANQEDSEETNLFVEALLKQKEKLAHSRAQMDDVVRHGPRKLAQGFGSTQYTIIYKGNIFTYRECATIVALGHWVKPQCGGFIGDDTIQEIIQYQRGWCVTEGVNCDGLYNALMKIGGEDYAWTIGWLTAAQDWPWEDFAWACYNDWMYTMQKIIVLWLRNEEMKEASRVEQEASRLVQSCDTVEEIEVAVEDEPLHLTHDGLLQMESAMDEGGLPSE